MRSRHTLSLILSLFATVAAAAEDEGARAVAKIHWVDPRDGPRTVEITRRELVWFARGGGDYRELVATGAPVDQVRSREQELLAVLVDSRLLAIEAAKHGIALDAADIAVVTSELDAFAREFGGEAEFRARLDAIGVPQSFLRECRERDRIIAKLIDREVRGKRKPPVDDASWKARLDEFLRCVRKDYSVELIDAR